MGYFEDKVFEIKDLRRYIFSFLRKDPKKKCYDCESVLIWDKKVNDYISISKEISQFTLPAGYYCMSCYSQKMNLNCNLL